MEILIPCFNTPSGVLRKKRPLNREYKNCVLIAIFVGTGLGVERCEVERCEVERFRVERHFFPSIPSPHLWDSRTTAATLILRHYLK